MYDDIRVGENKSISFGNYTSSSKIKVNEFNHNGDIYDLKTYKESTRLKKNDKLLFESNPGSCVKDFVTSDRTIKFEIEGFEDTQLTLELEANKEYIVYVDGVNVGTTKTKASGKINFSLDLSKHSHEVKIEKFDKN